MRPVRVSETNALRNFGYRLPFSAIPLTPPGWSFGPTIQHRGAGDMVPETNDPVLPRRYDEPFFQPFSSRLRRIPLSRLQRPGWRATACGTPCAGLPALSLHHRDSGPNITGSADQSGREECPLPDRILARLARLAWNRYSIPGLAGATSDTHAR